MAAVIWMPGALNDLESIADYIARDSMSYACVTVQRLFDAAQRLAEFPNVGRVVPEYSDERLREIIVGNYRVIYEVFDEHVEVLAVHHGARLLPDRP
ncbi:MAG: type II toxin-antitoxin system RelE/ParE family toxin [Phycisphaera sp.]|nr:type II toxin-antitoxin system RelE/ParE family toxin [Phycisphaera sp.]